MEDLRIKKHFRNSSWNIRMVNGNPNSPPDPYLREREHNYIGSMLGNAFSFQFPYGHTSLRVSEETQSCYQNQ
jgi:hypothetical protein